MWRKYQIVMAILMAVLAAGAPAAAQTPEKPFIMPVAGPPGPSTWLFGQAYGNTVGAFNFGQAWYSAGQGLHFGIDLPMPCGTALVAVADGEVAFVDNLGFGSGPHNLLIRHASQGVISLYGHLLETPALAPGQFVQQGDVIARSGDPDRTCDSRPHLHYEVRSLDFVTAYNPVEYIDAPWHSLAAVGAFNYPLFQQDLTNPRRWMSLDDQPAVSFGGARLNNYTLTYPPGNADRAPANPPLERWLDTPPEAQWQLRQLSANGCCPHPWWSHSDPDRLYVVDGEAGGLATIFGWSASQGQMVEVVGLAPPPLRSPDGTHEITPTGSYVMIRRLEDGAEWPVHTGGARPAFSADNSRLMWVLRSGITVPGSAPAPASVWVSDADGQNARLVNAEAGVSARWLDSARLLMTVPGEGRLTTLLIYDTRDDTSFTLGAWESPRSLSIAPGGGRLMFYLPFQEDPAIDGVYVIATEPGAQPERLPWFGAWRWRDADSVYYIPFDPASPQQTLAYYDIPSRTSLTLTDPATAPFTIANGDWDVSADGRRIVFQSAADGNLWLLEAVG